VYNLAVTHNNQVAIISSGALDKAALGKKYSGVDTLL
jgi:hypothetical protein